MFEGAQGFVQAVDDGDSGCMRALAQRSICEVGVAGRQHDRLRSTPAYRGHDPVNGFRKKVAIAVIAEEYACSNIGILHHGIEAGFKAFLEAFVRSPGIERVFGLEPRIEMLLKGLQRIIFQLRKIDSQAGGLISNKLAKTSRFKKKI